MTEDGPYEWQRCLGRGSTGQVWSARCDGADIAVKVLLDTRPDSPHAEAIRREMRLGPMLADHPNIVAVRKVREIDGVLHLEMDLVNGPSLDHVLEGRLEKGKGPLPPRVAVDFATQILDTLDWACRRVAPENPDTFVHRDIKPGNLLLAPSGRIRITDFGMARAGTELGFQTTQTGIVKGTPRFMAPELLVEKGVDALADQFSAGVMLYELLSGEPLYKGNNLADVLIMAVNADVERQIVALNVDPELIDVIRTLLQRDKRDRFPTHADAVEALKKLKMRGRSLDSMVGELIRDANTFHQPPEKKPELDVAVTPPSVQAVARLEVSKSDPLFPDEEATLVVKALPTMSEHVAFPAGSTLVGDMEVTFEITSPFADTDGNADFEADVPTRVLKEKDRDTARIPEKRLKRPAKAEQKSWLPVALGAAALGMMGLSVVTIAVGTLLVAIAALIVLLG